LLEQCESQEEMNEIFKLPIIKLFTKNKVYDVLVTDTDWRVLDDTSCIEDDSYNHIIFTIGGNEDNDWFHEFFEVTA
jgi:hypothetical protein